MVRPLGQAASASCAYSTEMSRASMMNIALILDAILLASIYYLRPDSPCHSGIRTGSGPVWFWYWYCWQQSIIIRRDRDEVHNCLIQ